jgi:hypothetical protein
LKDREERIRERAHRIWEQEGQPHGRDRDHWQRAMQEIDEESGQSAGRHTHATHAPGTRSESGAPITPSDTPGTGSVD